MARARARAGAKARVSHRLVDELDDAADDRVIPALQRGQRDDRVELHDRRHDVERGAPPVAHSSALSRRRVQTCTQGSRWHSREPLWRVWHCGQQSPPQASYMQTEIGLCSPSRAATVSALFEACRSTAAP